MALVGDGEKSALAHPPFAHAGDVRRQVRAVLDKPLQPALEVRQFVQHFRLKSFDGEQRDQPYHRANFHGKVVAIRQIQYVIKEAVFFVPQAHSVAPTVAHSMSDVDEVFPELASHVFVGWLLRRKFQGDGEQIQGVHRHPTRSIGLFEVSACGQGRAAIEDADVVQAKEAALKDVHALGVFAIHPPGEVEQKFMEHPHQELAVALAGALLVDLVHAPCGPGMDGRVDVAKSPFVSWNLAVGMHVPLAQHQGQLFLGKFRIH